MDGLVGLSNGLAPQDLVRFATGAMPHCEVMVERAALRLDSGDELRVELDRDALDGPEIVVRRTDGTATPTWIARRRRPASRAGEAARCGHDRSAVGGRS
jgi:hypothetical protein